MAHFKIGKSRSYRSRGWRGVADRRNHVTITKLVYRRKGM